MIKDVQKLSEILIEIDALPWNYALFLPVEKPWNGDALCVVLDPNDSEDADEDPEMAKQLNLTYALSVQDAQSIVANAKEQLPTINMQGLVDALNFYHANDAFIIL